MNWNSSNSIKLTKMMIVLFFFALVIMDLGSVYLSKSIYENAYSMNREFASSGVVLTLLLLCSIPAYITLYFLYSLVLNIQQEQIFITRNVTALRVVSWCCTFVSGICLVSGIMVWHALLVVSVAAGFMALIVRVVKNMIEQAIEMKDELDFTI